MTETQKKAHAIKMAFRRVAVAALISTLRGGDRIRCDFSESAWLGTPPSLSSFFACLRAARDLRVGRAMAGELSGL